MKPDVTVIMPARDMERAIAPMVRTAAKLEELVERPDDLPGAGPLVFELLALDERSGDNTLSVLSVLHAQVHNLRTLQDVDPGTAIRRASAVARGDTWLVIDHAVDPELAAWGVSQVLRGHRAAIVPGEILAVDRHVGALVLRPLGGGLVSAQNAVVRHLRAHDDQPAWSPPRKQGTVHRARLFFRGGLGRLGLSRFDRPSGR